MMKIHKVVFLICIITCLTFESLQTEIRIKHDAGEIIDDKNKSKHINKNNSYPELFNKYSTDDPYILDKLFIFSDDSNKKSKLKLSKSQLDDFFKDEIFLQESKALRKRLGFNSLEPFPNEQIILEILIRSSNDDTLMDPGLFKEIQLFDGEGFKEDKHDEAIEPQIKSQFSKINKSILAVSTTFQRTKNVTQESDREVVNPKSFIFNPHALPQERFQNCTTPKNESGTCKYLQHCTIPTTVSSLNQFLEYVCVIEGRFIGVCCPNFPVSIVVIQQHEGHNEEQKSELNQNCGVATNTRIVGGSTADPKAWPWMVALFSKYRRKFFCGGVLINDRYVLTAAHCTFGVLNNEIIARVGEYDFKDNGKSHDEYVVVEIKRHGRYNRRILRNDIALLKLEKPVVFNEFVKTVCFPEEENFYVGKKATLAGWGHLFGGGATSDVLQQASFPVISNKKCSLGHGLPIPDSLICTGSMSGDKGACNGDSGGPLMLLDQNNHWKVIGLVSWGRRGCNPKFPTVYTRVSYFLEWIKKHSR